MSGLILGVLFGFGLDWMEMMDGRNHLDDGYERELGDDQFLHYSAVFLFSFSICVFFPFCFVHLVRTLSNDFTYDDVMTLENCIHFIH